VVPKKWVVLSALTSVSFLSWMLEGSVGDWSGLYNIQVLGVSSASATMPFAVYQASLVLGRAGYDYIVDRYISRKNMIMMNGLIGAIGLVIVVVAGFTHDSVSFPLNLLGFGISGLGMSTLWPIVTSWCGNIDGVDMTYAVSVVNGVSYCALLAGPPILGFIAEATGSLTYSFATAAGLCLLCIPLAAFLQ
jgi:MFS family permease